MGDSTAHVDSTRLTEGTDSGVSTIFACFSVVLMIIITAGAVHLGGAILARQRAETAADLGALAGAAVALSGIDAACARAQTVIESNHGHLVSCAADGLDVLVEVQIPTWAGPAGAHARAGPVSTP